MFNGEERKVKEGEFEPTLLSFEEFDQSRSHAR